MNAATRGVILAVAAVVLGALVLGQGFGGSEPTLTAAGPATSGGDGGSSDGTAEPAPADEPADDGSASDDGDSADAGATDDGGEPAADGGTDGLTDPDDPAGDDGESPVPDITHPPAEVRVLVANGTSVAGAAGRVNDQLTGAGYNGLTPTNADSVDASVIYYEPGYELDARLIARNLNAAPEAVLPMPDAPPVSDLSEAHVLVVLGPDLAS